MTATDTTPARGSLSRRGFLQRSAIADVKRFYANNGGSNMSVMTQAADDLDDAIKAKDSAKFVSAYAKLTAGCNACHEQTGFGFIKI